MIRSYGIEIDTENFITNNFITWTILYSCEYCMNIRNKMFQNNNVLPVMSGMLQIFIAKKLPFCYFSIEYYLHIYTMYNEYFLTSMNPQY